MLKRLLFLFALALIASPLLFAQITTSSLVGTVKNTTDEPLVGATVIATHLPSGTKYTTTSRSGGVINIQNMRVGGPYLVEISFVGHDSEKMEDVYLQLAEAFSINVLLKKSVSTLENVIVTTTGRRNSVLNPGRTGSVTNIGLRQISQAPTISRSVDDLTRFTPQANGASIGGGNYRQNNFTIDGSEFNNSFGISSGGAGNMPGGGTPVSIDALEEVSVSLTPFDIRQSGFIGSAINAVTRAGTNTITGSVYKYFRTEKNRGRRVEDTYFTRPEEEFNQFGFRIGGPLIKNKLFFFFNYETEKEPKSIQTRFAATTAAPWGSASNISRPTADSLNYIRQFLKDNYGYDPGEFDNYVPDKEKTKILTRIDWNISPKHKLVMRYSQVTGREPFSMSSSTPPGVTGTGGRNDANAMGFRNTNYYQGIDFYSFAAELNSTFGKVSNTFRGTFTFQDEVRKTDAPFTFPLVDIMSTTGVSQSTVYTSFGYEPFSFNNLRKVKTYSIIDNLTWVKNKHNWTVGLQIDFNEAINGFNPYGASYYRFATFADFASSLNPNPALRAKPTDFAITYSLSKNFAPAFSAFKTAQYSVYGQDEITLNKNFRLTVGLRLDRPTFLDAEEIKTNPLLLSLTFDKGEKLNSGNLPKDRIMWSPRIGFNWDLYGDRSFQVRGGSGLFTGKVPFVWATSQSGTSGMVVATLVNNGAANTPGPFNPDPNAYRPSSVPAAGTLIPNAVTIIDPDFKFPQTWKSSVAIDRKLPWGIIGTMEVIYSKDLNTVAFRNPNFRTGQPLNVAGYPDNRIIYGATVQTRFINTLNSAGVPVANGTGALNPVVLYNRNQGHYASLMIKFEKPFTKGFSGTIAYTKSIANNLHDGQGDQPGGSWSGTPTVNDLSSSTLGMASYVVPDRVIAAFSYRKEYLKHLATTISVVYTGSIDGRFSYLYGADFNLDGITSNPLNDLIYIPTSTQVQQMRFASQTTPGGQVYNEQSQRDLFEAYILQDKYLKAHRGQYAERNGAQMPWRNRVDVKFIQDIFAKTGKNRNTLQFTLDIINFGNLLNPSWGKAKLINAPGAFGTAAYILTPVAGTIVPGSATAPQFRLALDRGQMITRTFRDDVSIFSTYAIQFGIRYSFN